MSLTGSRKVGRAVVRSFCATKLVNDGLKPACGQFQSRQCDGQLETPWPGASGIQVEDPVNSFDPRSMRNDYVKSAPCRIELQFLGRSPSRTSTRPTSPAWMICATPASHRSLGPQQAMSVRDDANPQHCAVFLKDRTAGREPHPERRDGRLMRNATSNC